MSRVVILCLISGLLQTTLWSADKEAVKRPNILFIFADDQSYETVRAHGNDEIYSADGDDTLYGDAGIDTLYGGDGSDTLYGGDGNDIIYAGHTSTYSGGASASL